MDAGLYRGTTRARHGIARPRSLPSPAVRWPRRAPSGISRYRRLRRDAVGYVASAETNYAAGLDAEAANDPVAIDYFYVAATESWPLHAANAAAPNDAGSELYRASVRKLLDSATRYGRFDSSRESPSATASGCRSAMRISFGNRPISARFCRWDPTRHVSYRSDTCRAASVSSTSCAPARCPPAVHRSPRAVCGNCRAAADRRWVRQSVHARLLRSAPHRGHRNWPAARPRSHCTGRLRLRTRKQRLDRGLSRPGGQRRRRDVADDRALPAGKIPMCWCMAWRRARSPGRI